jgi:hypothetical protein
MTLYKKDGSPRRELPECPFCDEDAAYSEFSSAWCRACSWSGTLAELLEADLRRRPGANLLTFLAARKISLGAFARQLWPAQQYPAALANLRKYTHPSKRGPGAPTWPGPAMLQRWGDLLGIDPGSFLRPRRSESP